MPFNFLLLTFVFVSTSSGLQLAGESARQKRGIIIVCIVKNNAKTRLEVWFVCIKLASPERVEILDWLDANRRCTNLPHSQHRSSCKALHGETQTPFVCYAPLPVALLGDPPVNP